MLCSTVIRELRTFLKCIEISLGPIERILGIKKYILKERVLGPVFKEINREL